MFNRLDSVVSPWADHPWGGGGCTRQLLAFASSPTAVAEHTSQLTGVLRFSLKGAAWDELPSGTVSFTSCCDPLPRELQRPLVQFLHGNGALPALLAPSATQTLAAAMLRVVVMLEVFIL